MIINEWKNAQMYSPLLENLGAGIQFAESLLQVPSGRYEGDNGIFALVQEGMTGDIENDLMESHRKYIDVQLVVDGSEYIEWTEKMSLDVKFIYNEEKDVELSQGSGQGIIVTKGQFYIMFPQDAHKCCGIAGEKPCYYKKIVLKIPDTRISTFIKKDRKWANMKISVVGSINMDMTVTVDRIPLKGETLTGNDIQYIPGGKGANQAVAMAKLGAEVEMFGCVGADSNGEILVENLKDLGVIADHIKVIEGVPTGIASIIVGDNDNTIVVVAGANNCVDRIYVDSVKDEILKSDLVVLQHEIPIDTVEYVIEFCHKNGIKVILNPAPAHPVKPEILEMVDYLTPNEHEAVILFGPDITTAELLKRYPEKLVITQGSQGVSVCLKSGEVVNVPARSAKVVDTTGAGDTLNGAFAVKIVKEKSIIDALRFGNVAASLSTEKFGAQGGMPTYENVISEMQRLQS